MYIITDVCSSLDGEILRIDLLSTQILLKKTLKRDSINYCIRQHQVLCSAEVFPS